MEVPCFKDLYTYSGYIIGHRVHTTLADIFNPCMMNGVSPLLSFERVHFHFVGHQE